MTLNYEPGAGNKASKAAFDQTAARIERMGLTERQLRLNHLFSWYTTNQYDNRKVDFDGKERPDPIEREAIITASYIPPGFYDVGQQYPIKYRRPLAPYHLARVIVDRFTELLFSEGRIPKLRVLGDANTEDYAAAIIEETDYWGRWMMARKLGGAMGSVAVGFQFLDGEPRVEVHDPRWCFPEFEDRTTHKLKLIEKRWMYSKEERVPDGKGGWKWGSVAYWYRRIITKTQDIVFKPAKVEKGEEPIWEIDFDSSVDHNLGFCPVVWVQNHEVLDDIDGESDCHGVYDMIEQMDLLTSMAIRGVVSNCDPTVVVTSDEAMSSISKGSDNTVKLKSGDDFKYVEIDGSGPKAARELSAELREAILEVTQTHLQKEGSVAKTATEVEREFASMLAKASMLRRQYGKGAVALMKMILRAAQRMAQGFRGEDGQMVKMFLKLPPRVEEDEEGKVTITPRKLGGGGHIRLTWPRFFEYTLEDVAKATTSAGEAKEKGLIDQKHASGFVGEMYHVDNVSAMLKSMKDEEKAAAEAEQAAMEAQMGGMEPPAY